MKDRIVGYEEDYRRLKPLFGDIEAAYMASYMNDKQEPYCKGFHAFCSSDGGLLRAYISEDILVYPIVLVAGSESTEVHFRYGPNKSMTKQVCVDSPHKMELETEDGSFVGVGFTDSASSKAPVVYKELFYFELMRMEVTAKSRVVLRNIASFGFPKN